MACSDRLDSPPLRRHAPRLTGGGPPMLVRYFVAALLLTSAAVPAHAGEAQDLIAKNVAARGGNAALSAIKSISFEGRTIFPGNFELTYKETRAEVGAGTASRVDLSVQGLDLVQAYDGHGGGWRINPFQGRK